MLDRRCDDFRLRAAAEARRHLLARGQRGWIAHVGPCHNIHKERLVRLHLITVATLAFVRVEARQTAEGQRTWKLSSSHRYNGQSSREYEIRLEPITTAVSANTLRHLPGDSERRTTTLLALTRRSNRATLALAVLPPLGLARSVTPPSRWRRMPHSVIRIRPAEHDPNSSPAVCASPGFRQFDIELARAGSLQRWTL